MVLNLLPDPIPLAQQPLRLSGLSQDLALSARQQIDCTCASDACDELSDALRAFHDEGRPIMLDTEVELIRAWLEEQQSPYLQLIANRGLLIALKEVARLQALVRRAKNHLRTLPHGYRTLDLQILLGGYDQGPNGSNPNDVT